MTRHSTDRYQSRDQAKTHVSQAIHKNSFNVQSSVSLEIRKEYRETLVWCNKVINLQGGGTKQSQAVRV